MAMPYFEEGTVGNDVALGRVVSRQVSAIHEHGALHVRNTASPKSAKPGLFQENSEAVTGATQPA